MRNSTQIYPFCPELGNGKRGILLKFFKLISVALQFCQKVLLPQYKQYYNNMIKLQI